MSSSRVRSSEGMNFDLSNQDGILKALYAVRISELSAAERNELRDQLFILSRSPDPNLQGDLEERLAKLSLSVGDLDTSNQAQVTGKTKGSHNERFSNRRRTPKFAVSNKKLTFTPKSISKEDSEPIRSVVEETSVDEPSKNLESVPAQDVADDGATTGPTPPKPSPPVETTPSDKGSHTEKAAEPVTDVSESKQNSSGEVSAENADFEAQNSTSTSVQDTTQPNSAPDDAHTSAPTTEPTIDRIREIKRFVNSKIGNPVNLVDLDNQIGRAYMTALLAAMQSVNNETGRAGTEEMAELEKIFTQVQTILLQSQEEKSPEKGTQLSDSTLIAQQADISQKHALVKPSQVDKKGAINTRLDEQKESRVQQESANLPPLQPNDTNPYLTKDVDQSESENLTSASNATTERSQEDTPVSVPVVGIDKQTDTLKRIQTPSEVRVESPPPQQTSQSLASEPLQQDLEPAPPNTATNNGPGPISAAANKRQNSSTTHRSVAQDTKQSIDAQLEELDAAAAAQNKYSGDPHYAPEVEMGLDQLLMEWSLFKSSGLFGTGPNGREHPLFKKLAPLMVNDILLGRFDGSRPEIIQSITDYMNGWRYEQGIVYQSGETFEAYLRRVIRYIIDSKS